MQLNVIKDKKDKMKNRSMVHKCRKLKNKVKAAIGKILPKKKIYQLSSQKHQQVESDCEKFKKVTEDEQILCPDDVERNELHTSKQQENYTRGVKNYSSEARISVLPPFIQKTEEIHFPVFEELDQRAISISQLSLSSLKVVHEKLTLGCLTETSKARVIFRWVVEMYRRQKKTTQPRERQCYHKLFKELCSYAGLRCEIIRGRSKGVGYDPVLDQTENCFRNTWTAVSINDQWKLVNVTWAARQMYTQDGSQVDDFYFLSDPRKYIYQHFPNDPRWQLLETPKSLTEFTKLPFLNSTFFNRGLSLKSNQQLGFDLEEKKTELRITVPEDIDIGLEFQTSDKSENIPGDSLDVAWDGNIAILTVRRSPWRHYSLSVYVGTNDDLLEIACRFVFHP